MVEIQQDKYEISWGIDKANDVTPEVDVNIPENDSVSENEKKMLLSKLVSSISFKDLFSEIDLNYQIRPDSVKENIILNSRMSEYNAPHCQDKFFNFLS